MIQPSSAPMRWSNGSGAFEAALNREAITGIEFVTFAELRNNLRGDGPGPEPGTPPAEIERFSAEVEKMPLKRSPQAPQQHGDTRRKACLDHRSL